MKTKETICAISTPAGVGGVALVRVSGENAFEICDKIFHFSKNKISEIQPNLATFGQIRDGKEILDEVLLTPFHAPNSFTGEDTVEISCHGSLFIQQEILRLLLQNGCRLAQPGEFTQRAFLNGKIDLSQAEAVADVISSKSQSAHRMAIQQMRGGFSAFLATLRAKLLDFTSLVELELDFSDHEDLEFADRSKLQTLVDEILQEIKKLKDSFRAGNALKNGIPVAIIGETNAGKSTLLNALVGEERAIVSDIDGTTRDVIEDTVSLHGILFRFIDTAGIRQTADTIESLGIERSYQTIEKADIVLWVINSLRYKTSMEWLSQNILPRVEGKKLMLVFNKIDRLEADERQALENAKFPFATEIAFISAKKQLELENLREKLHALAGLPEVANGDITVTNLRHYEALRLAHLALERVADGLQQGISGDLLTIDLRECLHHLGEITGEITTDEILGNIFGKFCIGK